ncbi:phosphatase [Acinetobacter sp. NCu2D-2]|uniref:phosphatase PAP2/dual specificity phosphatase family protein n=1 Tax=Acinetobacter sp. NCu2D-2 TaxID=1608473 RepID=UPI0007CDBEFB|nr:phosphatase PAP2/dual specificity phosphatase family protein [Acinetobacter sp. NCu2D-2]ANF81745.1 phosphatase [Acinetobacter sp. NCu2D-2]
MQNIDDMPRENGTWKYGVIILLFLAPFFFWSYGLANQYASSLTHVPSVVFAWEKNIPIWSWSIVPYWSIDLFYGLSLLLCCNKFELKQQSLRLLFAQLISVTCFFIYPLAFSFERPSIEGFFGHWFDILMSFDQPFNQAPSLHIVLLVILWDFYRRHSNGYFKNLVDIWSLLIGISVLTTWQHHFIDVPTGLLVGALCLWLFPIHAKAPWQSGLKLSLKHIKLGLLYLIGVILLTVLSLHLQSWALWLLYPAFSLLLVALAYFFARPHFFQKNNHGRFTSASWILFSPYIALAWLNSRIWTQKHPEDSYIIHSGNLAIYLGRLPSIQQSLAYSALFDCCAELPVSLSEHMTSDASSYCQYLHLDLTVIAANQLAEAVERLDTQIKNLNFKQDPQKLLLFCALGYSRSSAILCAYLISHGAISSIEQAIAMISQARPHVVLKPAQIKQIQIYQLKLKGLAP